jgi:hypothetical protein
MDESDSVAPSPAQPSGFARRLPAAEWIYDMRRRALLSLALAAASETSELMG